MTGFRNIKGAGKMSCLLRERAGLPFQLTHRIGHSATYIYPVRACAASDYVIGRGVCCLHFFGTNLISPKILTFRGLF